MNFVARNSMGIDKEKRIAFFGFYGEQGIWTTFVGEFNPEAYAVYIGNV